MDRCLKRKRPVKRVPSQSMTVADALGISEIDMEYEGKISRWASFMLSRFLRELLKKERQVTNMKLDEFYLFVFTNDLFEFFESIRVGAKLQRELDMALLERDRWDRFDLTVEQLHLEGNVQDCAIAVLLSILPKILVGRVSTLRVGYVYHLLYESSTQSAVQSITDGYDCARLRKELSAFLKILRSGPDSRFTGLDREDCTRLESKSLYLATNPRAILKHAIDSGRAVRFLKVIMNRLLLTVTAMLYLMFELLSIVTDSESTRTIVEYLFIGEISARTLGLSIIGVVTDSQVVRSFYVLFTTITMQSIWYLLYGTCLFSNFCWTVGILHTSNYLSKIEPLMRWIADHLKDYKPSLGDGNPYYDVDFWRSLGVNDEKLFVREFLSFFSKLDTASPKLTLPPAMDLDPDTESIVNLNSMDERMIGSISPEAFSHIDCKDFLQIAPSRLVWVSREQLKKAPHLISCISAHQLLYLGCLYSFSNKNPINLFGTFVEQLSALHLSILRLRNLAKVYIERIDSSQLQCPVCYAGFEQLIRFQCGHAFCEVCTSKFRSDNRCPNCRVSISRTEVVNAIDLESD